MQGLYDASHERREIWMEKGMLMRYIAKVSVAGNDGRCRLCIRLRLSNMRLWTRLGRDINVERMVDVHVHSRDKRNEKRWPEYLAESFRC